MADFSKLNILLYCNRPAESENAGTVIDHIDAFAKYSRHNILLVVHEWNFREDDADEQSSTASLFTTLFRCFTKNIFLPSLSRKSENSQD